MVQRADLDVRLAVLLFAVAVPVLLPILDDEYVARKTVQAVRRNRRRLMMPRFVYLVPLMRVFPACVLDTIAGWLGINVAMASFEGRRDSH